MQIYSILTHRNKY